MFNKRGKKKQTTVEAALRTPRYYRASFVPSKSSRIFSRLLRTPVNTDNGHFSVSRVTNSYTSSTPLYGHCLSVHFTSIVTVTVMCQFETLYPGRIMSNFGGLTERCTPTRLCSQRIMNQKKGSAT